MKLIALSFLVLLFGINAIDLAHRPAPEKGQNDNTLGYAYFPRGCNVSPAFYGGCQIVPAYDWKLGAMDVPAIKVWDGKSPAGMCESADAKPIIGIKNYCMLPRETCADTERILMTAEDGLKHCLKFPKSEAR